MMEFKVYNEDGELMRIVHRREEAQALCAKRRGWSFTARRRPNRSIDLSTLGEALI